MEAKTCRPRLQRKPGAGSLEKPGKENVLRKTWWLLENATKRLKTWRCALDVFNRKQPVLRGGGDIGTLVPCGWECRLVQPPWKTV